ncbi:NnrU family protein, partial [Hydrogenophaga sp.]|uniref:NnrU family protein n=1 Tax=Hydrogenophaga sp. TaxID=1904254 RepID=UPI002B57C4FF
MTWLILGLVIFLGVHSVSIVAPAARERWLAKMGEGGWKGLYSLLAFVGLALIVWGYGQARFDPVYLYTPPTGLRHLSALLMLPVFPLLLAPYLPGRIKTLTRHPMLVATKLWALAHLLANGTLADVLLFGGFLAWAVADRISVKRREQAGQAREVPGLPASGLNDA